MQKMNLPNNLSILRILLVPIFIACLLYYVPEREYLRYTAIGLFIIACFTDAADGFMARRMNQRTRLGSFIDPLADKILILGGFISLSFMGNLPPAMRIPAWVTLIVVSRDVLILLGAILIFITTGALTPKPLFVGKATTASQMLAILAALALLPEGIDSFLFAATAILTVLSGSVYLKIGSRILQSNGK
jgi:cardiolipin synthase